MANYVDPINVKIICFPWVLLLFCCTLEKIESNLDLLFRSLHCDHSLLVLVHLPDGDERF